MAAGLILDDDKRAELSRIARSLNEPDVSIRQTAKDRGPTAVTVTAWRDAFMTKGLSGLGVIAPGRGRTPIIGGGVIEAIVSCHDPRILYKHSPSKCELLPDRS